LKEVDFIHMSSLVNRLSEQMTEEVLQLISTSYGKLSGKNYWFKVNDLGATLQNNEETIVLASGCRVLLDSRILDFANAWNEKHRLSKCFLKSSYAESGEFIQTICVESVYVFEDCPVDFLYVAMFFSRFSSHTLKTFFIELNEFYRE
jgi:hypothetical protein